MSEPKVAQVGPYSVQVEAGRRYLWCACGHSNSQPFCDGSHNAVGMLPIVYEATETGTAYFCGCKNSQEKPLCDGTHETL